MIPFILLRQKQYERTRHNILTFIWQNVKHKMKISGIMNQVIENYATSFLFCRIKNATAAVQEYSRIDNRQNKDRAWHWSCEVQLEEQGRMMTKK